VVAGASAIIHRDLIITLAARLRLPAVYPWEVVELPPVWYKSAPYRSRAVADPRGVLAEFGVTLPPGIDTRVRINWRCSSRATA